MLRTAAQTRPPATESTAPLAEDQSNTGNPGWTKVKRIAAMERPVSSGQMTKAFTLSSRILMQLTSLQEAANQREALHRKRPNVSGVPSRCGTNTSKQSKKLRQTLAPM